MINNKKKTAFLAAAVFLSTSCSAVFASAPEMTSFPAKQIQSEETKDVGANTFAERIRNIIAEYDAANGRVPNYSHMTKPALPSQNPADYNNSIASNSSGVLATPLVPATPPAYTPPPVVQPEPEQVRDYTWEPRYDFDWQGTPLNTTLYAISKVSGKRIVVNGELEGTVFTSMNQVTYEQALSYLSKAFNFNYMVEDDDTIIVSTSELMKQNKVFKIHYADRATIQKELQSLGFEENNIFVNMEQNTVSVTGTPYQISRAQQRLASIDKPVKQVLLLAQLIEISHGKSLNLGMSYNLPSYEHAAGDALTGKFGDKLSFGASLEAARALEKGHVIARPMVMMRNGVESSIVMGERVPVLTSTTTTASTSVSFEYQDVGNNLKVTPVINESTNEIILKLNLEVSNISKWTKQGNVQAPQISTRKANTVVTLQNGQSFVIGGLMTKSELDNLSGIPGLMNLPILGELFKRHSKSSSYSEVFIMITPYIVTDGIDPQRLMKASE